MHVAVAAHWLAGWGAAVKAHTYVQTFDTDPGGLYGTASIVDGAVRAQHQATAGNYSGITVPVVLDLADSSLAARISRQWTIASGEATYGVRSEATNADRILFGYAAGTYICQVVTGNTIVGQAYPAREAGTASTTALRIRHSGTSIVYEASTDGGATWPTVVATLPAPAWSLARVLPTFGSGWWDASNPPDASGYALLHGLNADLAGPAQAQPVVGSAGIPSRASLGTGEVALAAPLAVVGTAGIAPRAALGTGAAAGTAAPAVVGSAGIPSRGALGTGTVALAAPLAVVGTAGIPPQAALGVGSVAQVAGLAVVGLEGIPPQAALGVGSAAPTAPPVLEGTAGIPPRAALGTGEVALTAPLAVVGLEGIPSQAALGVGSAVAVEPQAVVGTAGIPSRAALGVGSLPLFVDGVDGNNLLSDGGFERTLAGATAQGTGTAVFRDNDEQVRGGTWSLKVVPGSPGAGHGVQTIGGGGPTPGIPVTGNEVYTASAYVWANEGEVLRFTMRYAASPSAFLTSDTTWTETGWRRLVLTNRSPLTATNLSLKVETVAASSGAPYFVDDAQIERNGAPTEFGSGGIPPRVVLGTGVVTRTAGLAVVGTAGIPPQAALGVGSATAVVLPQAVVGTAGIPPRAALGAGAVTQVAAGQVGGAQGIPPQAALGTGVVTRTPAPAVAGSAGIPPRAALGTGVVQVRITGTAGIAPRAALGTGTVLLGQPVAGTAGIPPRAALGTGTVRVQITGTEGIAPRAALGVGIIGSPYTTHVTGYARLPYVPAEAVLARVQGAAYLPRPPAAEASLPYAPGDAVLTPQRALAVFADTRGYATMDHEPGEADLSYSPGLATIDRT